MPHKSTGIRWDATRKNYILMVEVGTGSRRDRLRDFTRMPADTPLRVMKQWREQAKMRLRAQLADPPPADAPPADVVTFDMAVAAFLKTLKGRPFYQGDQSIARSWRAATDENGDRIGPLPLESIKPSVYRAAWTEWKAAGRAPSTLNHRRTFLLGCLRLYDVDHDTKLEAKAERLLPYATSKTAIAKELDRDIIDALLASMTRGRSWAMLWIMAETGLPAATIRRMQPTDIHPRTHTMTLPVRRKGGQADGVVVNLTPEALQAFQAYADLGWHPCVNTTLDHVWHEACARLRQAGTPVPHSTPYTLRHSFASRVLQADPGNVEGLQVLLQHTNVNHTMRYAKAQGQRAATTAIAHLAEANRQRRISRFSVVKRPEIPTTDPNQSEITQEK